METDITYLVRKKKSTVAHIWTGRDTACRMYSTGGLVKRKYELSASSRNLPTCAMCAAVLNRKQEMQP